MNINALRAAVADAGVDGWLFYDFRRSNPIAHRILGLPERAFFSRRWMYYVPAQGEPTALVSAVEAHVLDSLPGATLVYRSWREYQSLLAEMLTGAARVAMEYVPENAIPYCSRVDAGTVELVRRLGVEVTSSADFAQRFEAVLTPTQIDSHRAAGEALFRARDELLGWIRSQVSLGATVTEYDLVGEFARLMAGAGLKTGDDYLPHAAVNANAANPHYAPTAERSALVKKGDLLLLDFWAPLEGDGNVVADYTWMYMLDDHVPERTASLFAVVREARDAGIDLLRRRFEAHEPLRGFEVDDVTRAVIADAGYGEAFVHRTGHNIGIETHGNGAHLDNLETHDSRLLLANTCTSVEPGIYLPQEGIGLRSEVDVLLLDGAIEVTGVPAQQEVIALLA